MSKTAVSLSFQALDDPNSLGDAGSPMQIVGANRTLVPCTFYGGADQSLRIGMRGRASFLQHVHISIWPGTRCVQQGILVLGQRKVR
jgi:hypothetical protein